VGIATTFDGGVGAQYAHIIHIFFFFFGNDKKGSKKVYIREGSQGNVLKLIRTYCVVIGPLLSVQGKNTCVRSG